VEGDLELGLWPSNSLTGGGGGGAGVSAGAGSGGRVTTIPITTGRHDRAAEDSRPLSKKGKGLRLPRSSGTRRVFECSGV